MHKKVLFIPFGVGLAHIGRLISIAKELRNNGVEIIFGVGGDAPKLLKKEKINFMLLPELDKRTCEKTFKQNNWSVFTRRSIEKFVKAEIELIKTLKPDLIVFDNRPTIKIAAKILKVPVISVTNVDTTRYYDFSKVKIPHRTYLGKFLPPSVVSFFDKEEAQKILKKIGPKLVQAYFLKELFKFNLVLASYKQRPMWSPYDLYTGDLTLLSDLPEFRPVKHLPKSMKLVGPIFWNGTNNLPKWSKEIEQKKDIVYVTASGTGNAKLFLKTLSFFEGTSFTVVATTGNTLQPGKVKVKYSNLYLTDFLPGQWIMSRAKVVVFPGGNSTAYQALTYGVPQIGTPLHLDQEDNVNQLVRLGTAIYISPKTIDRENFLNALGRIVVDPQFQKNCDKFKTIMSKYQASISSVKEIMSFLEKNETKKKKQ